MRENGIEAVVGPPSLIPTESGKKVKTDKRDSRKVGKASGERFAEKDLSTASGGSCASGALRTRQQILEHLNAVQ